MNYMEPQAQGPGGQRAQGPGCASPGTQRKDAFTFTRSLPSFSVIKLMSGSPKMINRLPLPTPEECHTSYHKAPIRDNPPILGGCYSFAARCFGAPGDEFKRHAASRPWSVSVVLPIHAGRRAGALFPSLPNVSYLGNRGNPRRAIIAPTPFNSRPCPLAGSPTS